MKTKEIKKLAEKLKRKLRQRKMNYEEIMDEFGIEYREAASLIYHLREDGTEVPYDTQENNTRYFWVPKTPMRQDQFKSYQLDKTGSGWHKIGVVSDTHLGSKYEDLASLEDVYDKMEDEAVELVLHAGDVTDGDGKVYRGHLNNIRVYGYHNLLDYSEKNYPSRDGVKTAAIAGNHDMSFWKHGGADILKSLCSRRGDIEYLGQETATVDLDGLQVYIVHPSGGVPYARSYRAQKTVEQMVNKPDVMISGHRHIAMYMPYLDVHTLEAGCFQEQTPYLARKGLFPEIGGWILEYKLDDDGVLEEMKPRWLDYRKQ